MPIATNPALFAPSTPDSDLACDVLFVGDYSGHDRDVVGALPALASRGHVVRVHGRGWEEVPAFEAIHRGIIGYDDLPRAYASARIVVDDATDPTSEGGSVDARLLDALAAGAIVVSNDAVGVRELFGEDIATWSDPASLVHLVEGILADPERAAAGAHAARMRIIAEHTYPVRASGVADALRAWASASRFGIRVGIPGWDVAESWGDYHFARAIQRQLERDGHPTRVHLLPTWTTAVVAREDVTLQVLGRREAPIRPSQVNLLWQISHPDLVTPALYDRYDHAFVASDPFAARMRESTRVPVTALHQATDPERFRPGGGGTAHELLFVANSRGVRRRIIEDLGGTRHDLAVYGTRWTSDRLAPKYHKGEGIPNAEVADYYGAAAIVLNDHWDDMRSQGFMSNRLYDALCCGAFVISDHVEGIEAEFDGAVATYRDAADLAALIERYLARPDERRRLGERGRQTVLARHTFQIRSREIERVAMALLEDRRSSAAW
jgi:spore maturation protein CgeB